MRVLFAAAEAYPLAKVGGLADVAGSLPLALARLGHDVRLIMPLYAAVDRARFRVRDTGRSFALPLRGGQETARIYEASLDGGVPAYLLENQRLYGRPQVYGEADDLERFLFFGQAVVEAPQQLGWAPQVLHCHDWHAAPALPILHRRRSQAPERYPWASLLTIHNLAYQGPFDDRFASEAGLREYLPEGAIGGSLHSFLGLGIYYADQVSTVSETYAREILTSEYGYGLEPVLQQRRRDLSGIVNGLGEGDFPAQDPHLVAKYDAKSLSQKAVNKAALQRRVGLPPDPHIPLLGMVGRLVEQKGADLLAEALEPLLSRAQVQLVVLGTGQKPYEEALADLARRYPRQAAVQLVFDASLASLIYGGADLFLMPSRYEPCGLGQMIAMRYGTVPVVRRTGGLADTVADCHQGSERGTGFVFVQYTAKALLGALGRALAAFQDQGAWRRLQLRGMEGDYSWEASARKYEVVYRRALERASLS
ncbi:MAG: glycogen synthase [Chloroflexi bacterium]|nr:glycogen synthase [Chloroflexota bacterium]